MTIWLANACEKLCATDLVSKVFKRCGLCNDMEGRENHLVRVRKLRNHQVPRFGAPPAVPLTPEDIKAFEEEDDKQKQDEKKRKRKLQLEKRAATVKRRRRD